MCAVFLFLPALDVVLFYFIGKQKSDEYFFVDPVSWIAFLYCYQFLPPESEASRNQHDLGVQHKYKVLYHVIMLINSIVQVAFLPMVRSAETIQQVLGLVYVFSTFTGLVWYPADSMRISLQDIWGDFKTVFVLTVSLVSKVTKLDDTQQIQTASALVYIWLWVLFFDLTIQRMSEHHTFFNGCKVLVAVVAIVENFFIDYHAKPNADMVNIFGYIRRIVCLIIAVLVLLKREPRIICH